MTDRIYNKLNRVSEKYFRGSNFSFSFFYKNLCCAPRCLRLKDTGDDGQLQSMQNSSGGRLPLIIIIIITMYERAGHGSHVGVREQFSRFYLFTMDAGIQFNLSGLYPIAY